MRGGREADGVITSTERGMKLPSQIFTVSRRKRGVSGCVRALRKVNYHGEVRMALMTFTRHTARERVKE